MEYINVTILGKTLETKVYDKSGLHSLAGFAFQIRVCFYYALQMDINSIVSFETLDDVTVQNSADLDKKEDYFINKVCKEQKTYKAIQVKRTEVNKTKAMRVLLNWILLESEYSTITDYILFVDAAYQNKDLIVNIKPKELYKYALVSKEKNINSLRNKVKAKFSPKGKYKDFVRLLKKIKLKYSFIGDDELNDLLRMAGSTHFKKSGVTEITYSARLQSALNELTLRILNCAHNKKPYNLDYKSLMELEERIIHDVTDSLPVPLSYSDFIKNHPIQIHTYKDKREYLQLNHCGLQDMGIKRRLQHCCYYSDYRYRNLSINKEKYKHIEGLELQTFEIFEETKENLQIQNEDTAYNRLTKTEAVNNMHTSSKEIQRGVCIYLTKEKDIVGNNQISWKDEDE